MAGLTRVHPATISLPFNGGGSSLEITYVEVDYLASVVYAGPLNDSSTRQIIAIEGVNQDKGIADFAAMTVVQTAVRALGTVDSIDLSSATVIKGGPSAALQDVVV
jgi:hypothetical protein